MRGLIPAHFMAEIEKVTGYHITELIDVFTGPSTGAILNAALNVPSAEDPSKPRFKSHHMVKFYEREGIKIFPPDKYRGFRGLIHDFNNRTMKISQLRNLFRHGYYDPRNLANALHAMYGEVKLSQTLKSLIIPFYNLDGEQLEILEEDDESDEAPVHTKNNFVDEGGYAVWLKNIKFGHNPPPTPDVSLFDAVLASTAAPTYFPCHHLMVEYPDARGRTFYSGIDGSIFDNPCVSYHGAIRQHLSDDVNVIMILLGTGHTLRSFKKEDWNRYGGLGIVDPMNDLPLINILFHASETALVESFWQELGEDLYVFNKSMLVDVDPEIQPNTQIDDANPENLKKLEHFFRATLEENQKSFDALCQILVQLKENDGAPPKSFWQRLFSSR